MGLYLDWPGVKFGKADRLIREEAAEVIARPPRTVRDLPPGKVLVCVVGNPTFEAAGVCLDDREMHRFIDGMRGRNHVWLVVDRERAQRLAPMNMDTYSELP